MQFYPMQSLNQCPEHTRYNNSTIYYIWSQSFRSEFWQMIFHRVIFHFLKALRAVDVLTQPLVCVIWHYCNKRDKGEADKSVRYASLAGSEVGWSFGSQYEFSSEFFIWLNIFHSHSCSFCLYHLPISFTEYFWHLHHGNAEQRTYSFS